MQVPFLDLKAMNDPLRLVLEKVYKEVFDDSHFIFGRQVHAFEEAFAAKTGVSHCVTVGNCTDALYITLKMMGIQAGDEVIVPAMTWISDAAAVSQLGAIPVFVDVDDQGLIDLNLIEAAISPKTKFIIPVHLYGQMVDMPKLMNLVRKYNLQVIEDCAQSHFAALDFGKAGTFGNAGVFSFYPSKNLGAIGDGGCITTNNETLALACRKFANHGGIEKDSHEFVGLNSRMDTIQAAVLLEKLRHIDQWTNERRRLASCYNTALNEINGLFIPKEIHGNSHVFHIYEVRSKRRNSLKSFLKEKGIQTQVHYPKAIPFTNAYSHLGSEEADFPKAYQHQEETLSLPLYPGMPKAHQDYVIEQVKAFHTL